MADILTVPLFMLCFPQLCIYLHCQVVQEELPEPWPWRYHNSLKFWKLLTKWHSATHQIIWIFFLSSVTTRVVCLCGTLALSVWYSYKFFQWIWWFYISSWDGYIILNTNCSKQLYHNLVGILNLHKLWPEILMALYQQWVCYAPCVF